MGNKRIRIDTRVELLEIRSYPVKVDELEYMPTFHSYLKETIQNEVLELQQLEADDVNVAGSNLRRF